MTVSANALTPCAPSWLPPDLFPALTLATLTKTKSEPHRLRGAGAADARVAADGRIQLLKERARVAARLSSDA